MANLIAQYTAGKKVSNPKPCIQFTIHSKSRISEYGINELWVENLWQKSKKVNLSDRILNNKFFKYGPKQDTVKYYVRCGYLLTVDQRDYYKPQLITITKQYSGPMRIR